MINKVILLGRVGRDAELKYHNGSAHAEFSVATTETWKDRNNGEKQTKTEWHNCQMWGKQAEALAKYILKGNLIYVEGKINTREWTDDSGNKRKAINVVVSSVQFVSNGKKREGDHEDGDTGNHPPAQDSAAPATTDDDLPF